MVIYIVADGQLVEITPPSCEPEEPEETNWLEWTTVLPI